MAWDNGAGKHSYNTRNTSYTYRFYFLQKLRVNINVYYKTIRNKLLKNVQNT